MTTYDFFIQHLSELGYDYDTGFLISNDKKSSEPLPANLIGFRFESGHQQIDLYIKDEFWDASKSHPKLAEQAVIETAAGDYRLTHIVK